jgi:hypothetical protein
MFFFFFYQYIEIDENGKAQTQMCFIRVKIKTFWNENTWWVLQMNTGEGVLYNTCNF